MKHGLLDITNHVTFRHIMKNIGLPINKLTELN